MTKIYALITGASSGLGADFAQLFAERGYSLILTARREDRLTALKENIAKDYDVDVQICPCDLSEKEGPEKLHQFVEENDLELGVLVNNAGIGSFGYFEEANWQDIYGMMNLNMQSLVHLTQLCLPNLQKQKKAKILMVSSVAGFTPCPFYAAYAATKSFVLSFSMALRKELENTNIEISILCPGSTETEFHKVSGRKHGQSVKKMMMSSYEVAKLGVDGLFQKKPIVVPGWFNKLSAFINRILPRTTAVNLAHKVMKGDE